MVETRKPDEAERESPTVTKTRVFERIEQVSRDRELLERALAELRKGTSLIGIGVLARTIEDDAEREAHLEEHWIGDERAQRVLRQGLLRAGELALERGLPVDAYWVFAGDRLEVAVSHNERQVTLIVVRPRPPRPPNKRPPIPHPRIDFFR